VRRCRDASPHAEVEEDEVGASIRLGGQVAPGSVKPGDGESRRLQMIPTLGRTHDLAVEDVPEWRGGVIAVVGDAPIGTEIY
jgi:hypothetical protein